jgi:putative FmdB family regulatory protein
VPRYDYRCSVCGHEVELLHGIHDPGPTVCPNCGAEGSMRKAFATPAIHYKGSGWAKKDRSATSSSRSAAAGGAKDAQKDGHKDAPKEGSSSSSSRGDGGDGGTAPTTSETSSTGDATKTGGQESTSKPASDRGAA